VRVLAMILAGGEGKRLFPLTAERARAAEARVRREAETVKVLEDELHLVRPLK